MSEIRDTAEKVAAKHTDCSAIFRQLADAIEEAIRNERERCARIADAEHSKLYHGVDYGEESDSPAFRIAAAIRTEGDRTDGNE